MRLGMCNPYLFFILSILYYYYIYIILLYILYIYIYLTISLGLERLDDVCTCTIASTWHVTFDIFLSRPEHLFSRPEPLKPLISHHLRPEPVITYAWCQSSLKTNICHPYDQRISCDTMLLWMVCCEMAISDGSGCCNCKNKHYFFIRKRGIRGEMPQFSK